jgi:hypothetical protein
MLKGGHRPPVSSPVEHVMSHMEFARIPRQVESHPGQAFFSGLRQARNSALIAMEAVLYGGFSIIIKSPATLAAAGEFYSKLRRDVSM